MRTHAEREACELSNHLGLTPLTPASQPARAGFVADRRAERSPHAGSGFPHGALRRGLSRQAALPAIPPNTYVLLRPPLPAPDRPVSRAPHLYSPQARRSSHTLERARSRTTGRCPMGGERCYCAMLLRDAIARCYCAMLLYAPPMSNAPLCLPPAPGERKATFCVTPMSCAPLRPPATSPRRYPAREGGLRGRQALSRGFSRQAASPRAPLPPSRPARPGGMIDIKPAMRLPPPIKPRSEEGTSIWDWR